MGNMHIEWSPELRSQLDELSGQQQQAIAAIVMAESKGEQISRLLKTPYSCRWCGAIAGHSRDGRDARKAILAQHEDACHRNGKPWHFAANLVTYYSKWRRNPDFERCLTLARREVITGALSSAVMILQMGSPDAAKELLRQVKEGEKDFDRRSAAIALLDRADLSTAGKTGVDLLKDSNLEKALNRAYGDDGDNSGTPA